MPTILNPAAFGMKAAGPSRLSAHRTETVRDNGFLPTRSPSRYQRDRTGRNAYEGRI